MDFNTIVALLLGVGTLSFSYLTLRRGTKIKELEAKVEHLRNVNYRISSKVNPESDRKLIMESRRSIQILDINALGILHHAREELITFLGERNGRLQVLLLDPRKGSFRRRMEFEEDVVGRIESEWRASIRILRGISRMSDDPKAIELRLYDRDPDRSLLIVDAMDQPGEESSMLISRYPAQSGTRGYEGGQFLSDYSLLRDHESFEKNQGIYQELWREGVSVDITEAGNI